MEAMTAVSVAALTVYDMCKSVAKEAEICSIRLVRKIWWEEWGLLKTRRRRDVTSAASPRMSACHL